MTTTTTSSFDVKVHYTGHTSLKAESEWVQRIQVELYKRMTHRTVPSSLRTSLKPVLTAVQASLLFNSIKINSKIFLFTKQRAHIN